MDAIVASSAVARADLTGAARRAPFMRPGNASMESRLADIRMFPVLSMGPDHGSQARRVSPLERAQKSHNGILICLLQLAKACGHPACFTAMTEDGIAQCQRRT